MNLADDEYTFRLLNEETEQTRGVLMFFLCLKVVDVDNVPPVLC